VHYGKKFRVEPGSKVMLDEIYAGLSMRIRLRLRRRWRRMFRGYIISNAFYTPG